MANKVGYALRGVPLGLVPRKELEAEVVTLHVRIGELQVLDEERSRFYVRDLVTVCRA